MPPTPEELLRETHRQFIEDYVTGTYEGVADVLAFPERSVVALRRILLRQCDAEVYARFGESWESIDALSGREGFIRGKTLIDRVAPEYRTDEIEALGRLSITSVDVTNGAIGTIVAAIEDERGESVRATFRYLRDADGKWKLGSNVIADTEVDQAIETATTIDPDHRGAVLIDATGDDITIETIVHLIDAVRGAGWASVQFASLATSARQRGVVAREPHGDTGDSIRRLIGIFE